MIEPKPAVDTEQKQLRIRCATEEQIPIFMQWGRKQKWNQSEYDADILYSADPHGYFIGSVGDQIVTIICAIKYPNETGFISFYITKPEHRGKGYGKQIFSHAMQYLKDVNIGLDGGVDVAHLYQKWGFNKYCQTISYSGYISDSDIVDNNIVQLKSIPFQKIAAYQHTVCPFQRDHIVQKFMEIPESLAIGYYENNMLKGYGILKKTYEKYRICSLYADNSQIAHKLFLRLINFPNKPCLFIMNVFDVNQKAVQLCQKYKMEVTYNAYRMYNKYKPNIQAHKIFAILSSDIG